MLVTQLLLHTYAICGCKVTTFFAHDQTFPFKTCLIIKKYVILQSMNTHAHALTRTRTQYYIRYKPLTP